MSRLRSASRPRNARTQHASRTRNALSAVLIALSCFLAPFGALAAWAAYGLADTGRYVTTMAPLAEDPAVRDAVADTVGAGIMREIDTGGLQARWGIQGHVDPFVHDAVRSFTRTAAFRTAWDSGNRAAHDAVLRALNDDSQGAVTVDLAPVTAQVKSRLAEDHVPLAGRIPVEHTEVSVLAAQDLKGLRKGFHVLEVAGFWLPVAAVVFALAGIAVAGCRRRAVTATALGTALGGALLGVALVVGRRLTLADLPREVSEPAAGAVYDALTGTLRTTSWLLLGVGLTVALGVWLGRNLRVGGAGSASGGGGEGPGGGTGGGAGGGGTGTTLPRAPGQSPSRGPASAPASGSPSPERTRTRARLRVRSRSSS